MRLLKELNATARFTTLVLVLWAVAPAGRAQSCPGGSLSACNGMCTEQMAGCTTQTNTDLDICIAGVNASYDGCGALASLAKSQCYADCQQQGGNVQQCQSGCDTAYSEQLLGCQAAQVGGTLGCQYAQQDELYGCTQQQVACNNNCSASCQ
jgi:hypothetical protein